MKIIKERPTTGQYLVVWEYDGRIWSDTMQVVNGEHLEYNQESDSFKPIYGRLCESIPLHYVVL